MGKRSLSLAIKRHKQKLKNLTPQEAEKLDEVKTLAMELMAIHNVAHMKFEYGYGWRYLGCCSATKITLQLNFVLQGDMNKIRNTLLHEIAHAIVGPDKGHRIEWQEKATELGVRWWRSYHK